MHDALGISYQNCERIARTSGSNFYRSFSLLRPEKRRAMLALYAYARVIDDLGDAPKGKFKKGTKKGIGVFEPISLHAWIHDLLTDELATVNAEPKNGCAGELSNVRTALRDAVQRFEIPLERLHEMIEGVAMDQVAHVRILDSAALDRYCYLVASSVGLACLSIWRGDTTKLKDAAIDCGIAFQLTNILRDVAEDAKQNRIYVPADLLESYKIDQAAWLECAPNGDWIAMLRSQIERAKNLYLSGWKICQALDSDGQRMFSLMWHTYHRLLLKIESEIESIWTHRTQLGRFEKVQLYFQHAITPSYLRFHQDSCLQEVRSE